ncbi:hypothetical protein FRC19_009812 [Serendipita sp. 401]|nr:hypothetical protein FRC19_009812 [Serendipita sp. 401]
MRLTVSVELHISKLKGSYSWAICMTSILMALSIPVWVHVREQLTGQSKPPSDTNSPQAIALSITAYVAVLSNGAAAIMSYFLLERLNSSELNHGTAVTSSTDVAQSSPPDSPPQNRLQDPEYVEEEGLCNSGRIQEILGNIKALTLATACSTGETLRRWYRRYHQSFAEAYCKSGFISIN